MCLSIQSTTKLKSNLLSDDESKFGKVVYDYFSDKLEDSGMK